MRRRPVRWRRRSSQQRLSNRRRLEASGVLPAFDKEERVRGDELARAVAARGAVDDDDRGAAGTLSEPTPYGNQFQLRRSEAPVFRFSA